MASEGTLVITERAGARRTVRLERQARPSRPFAPEGDYVWEVERYPNATLKTAQGLGPSDAAVTFTGVIKDKYFTDGFAEQMERALWSLRDAGELLDVEVMDWKRIAVLTKVRFPKHWRGHTEYELTFEPLNTSDDTSAAAPVFTPAQTPTDLSRGMSTTVSALNTLRASAPVGIVTTMLAAVDTSLVDLNDASGDLSSEVAQFVVIRSARELQDSARRATALAGRVLSSGGGLLDTFQNTTTADMTVLSDGLSILRTATFATGMMTSSRALTIQAVDAAAAFNLIAQSEVLTTLYARPGQALSDLSTRYYGTPHRWPDIARANGLATNYIEATRELVIPQ